MSSSRLAFIVFIEDATRKRIWLLGLYYVVPIAIAHLVVAEIEAVLGPKLRLDLDLHARRFAPLWPPFIIHQVSRDNVTAEAIGRTIKGTKVEAVLHARVSELNRRWRGQG